MSEAETIKRLIETVSPDDTAKLDEIDARVWCYLNNYPVLDNEIAGTIVYERVWKNKNGRTFKEVVSRRPKPHSKDNYTRSRDALKAIRPKGWQIYGAWDHGKWRFVLMKEENNFCSTFQPTTKDIYLPTEELAELHAIIQAIEFEREKP